MVQIRIIVEDIIPFLNRLWPIKRSFWSFASGPLGNLEKMGVQFHGSLSRKFHMHLRSIQSIWVGSGACHLSHFNFQRQALLVPSKGQEGRMQMVWLACSPNTYISAQVNHSDTLWGHREVTAQARSPLGLKCWKTTAFPVVQSCTFPAAASKSACEEVSCVWMHLMLCIIPVLNLLDDWA